MTKHIWLIVLLACTILLAIFVIDTSSNHPQEINTPAIATQSTLDTGTSVKPEQPAPSNPSSVHPSALRPKDIYINSFDDLYTLFDSLNYNTKSWQAGYRAVPRLTFDTVNKRWQTTSNQIPVQEKKRVFFRLMAPLILIANEKILLERQLISAASLDDPKLLALAIKYRVVDDSKQSVSEQQRQTLLQNVDAMPPSLVLAQAAEESGWATSRFTVEGNAFFGQWDFSGKGMAPKEQRTELGNYGLARFESPQASVEGYLLNLNTNNAYQKLRALRAQLRADNKPITGLELAGTLDKYSERGQAYIDGLREMIRYNKLEQTDEAYLSDDAPLNLITPPDK